MGDVNSKKNFHVLLTLIEQNPSLDLVISGRLAEPDYISEIKSETIRMGIDDRVHLTGPVTEEEKAWYLSNCHAYVHPSLAEGFGAPVVEAMKFGKPLFLSNRTSLPEIGGNVAFFFSSFEPGHMQQIYVEGMERYHREGMSSAIIGRGKEFDWEQSASRYLELYQSLY
jgi:glycosyltransferase involved in cell wall biosynthesis